MALLRKIMIIRRYLSYLAICMGILLVSSCNKETTLEGDRYFNNGEYKKAIESYNEYLKLKPSHVKSIYNRGRSYEELGDFQKAMEDFKRVLEIDDMNIHANMSVGMDAYRNGDYPNAVFYFEKSLKADPTNVQALVWRGRAHHRLGQFTEALADFDNAVRLDSDNGEAYYYRGIIYLESSVSKACADFSRAENLGVGDATKAANIYCKGR